MLLAILAAAALVGPPAPELWPVVQEQQRVMTGLVDDAFWIGTTGAGDLFTTALALKHCQSCAEGNPLGFSAEARIALKAGAALAATAGCYRLRKDGHHRWATGLRWGIVALNSLLIVNNSYHALKGK